MDRIELATMEMRNAQTWMDFITSSAQRELAHCGDWSCDWAEGMREAQARYDTAKAEIEAARAMLRDALSSVFPKKAEQ